MNYLITLVHGTFANKATWINENSDFCNSLKDRLIPNEIIFTQFNWSGENSHTGRLQAGQEFSTVLKNQLEVYPNYRKIIIGHSHGGNVATYALNQLQKESEKFELITLATPFVNPQLRKIDTSVIPYILFFGLLIFPMMVINSWLIVLINDFLYSNSFSSIIQYVGADTIQQYIKSFLQFIIVFLMFIPFITYQKLCDKYVRKMRVLFRIHRRKGIREVNEMTMKGNYSLFILYYNNDIIRLWLTLFGKIWEVIFGGYKVLSGTVKVIFYITMAVFIVLLIFGRNEYLQAASQYAPQYKFLFNCAIWIIVIFFLLTILGPILLVLIKSNPLFIGWESHTQQNVIRVSPSNIPFNKRAIVKAYKLPSKNLFSLNHSIYYSQNVINDIVDWIVSNNRTPRD